jgi:hypothetical protein
VLCACTEHMLNHKRTGTRQFVGIKTRARLVSRAPRLDRTGRRRSARVHAAPAAVQQAAPANEEAAALVPPPVVDAAVLAAPIAHAVDAAAALVPPPVVDAAVLAVPMAHAINAAAVDCSCPLLLSLRQLGESSCCCAVALTVHPPLTLCSPGRLFKQRAWRQQWPTAPSQRGAAAAC